MEQKVIDLEKTLYELCTEDPSFVQVMVDLGFADITKPLMLATAGKFMTLPKGCAFKGKDLGEVIAQLHHKGYTVIGSSKEKLS
ncbi:MAG: DUF1858 domain-containing protein [Sphaerochaetaceae bacterium]|jgi:hypothetical protein